MDNFSLRHLSNSTNQLYAKLKNSHPSKIDEGIIPNVILDTGSWM